MGHYDSCYEYDAQVERERTLNVMEKAYKGLKEVEKYAASNLTLPPRIKDNFEVIADYFKARS